MDENVTVLHRGRDRHGDMTVVGSATLHGCGFAPTGTSEETDSRETVVREAVLYLPAAALVRGTDLVRLDDGSEWQVVGEAEQFRSPLDGWRPGGQVTLRRVTG